MSRTIFALALVLASYTRAADDKPLVLLAGDPAPFAGTLLPTKLADRRAKEVAACRDELPDLRKAALKAQPAPWLVVVLVVAGIAAGGAAGYGIAKATQPKP